MPTILTFIVIDSKTNESETNLNIHSLPSFAGMTVESSFFFSPLLTILLIHCLIAYDIKRHFV